MIEQTVEVGPGSIRVGRFIGRVAAVPMPAIEHGLGLAGRVVRRHVTKLETLGWCERMPTIRGDGKLVWLTPSGLDAVGLAGLPTLRTPERFSAQTWRSIQVAWAAADIEHAGHQWITKREMKLTPDRWGAPVANERGSHSRRLPDLALWPATAPRLAIAAVVIHIESNSRRERAALAGWHAAIMAGQYAQVRYLAGPATATHLNHLASQMGLTAPQFIAGEHVMAHEPPPLRSTITNPEELSVDVAAPVAVRTGPAATTDLPPLSPAHGPECRGPDEPVMTPERQKLIIELLGHQEPTRRRRWGRRAT